MCVTNVKQAVEFVYGQSHKRREVTVMKGELKAPNLLFNFVTAAGGCSWERVRIDVGRSHERWEVTVRRRSSWFRHQPYCRTLVPHHVNNASGDYGAYGGVYECGQTPLCRMFTLLGALRRKPYDFPSPVGWTLPPLLCPYER